LFSGYCALVASAHALNSDSTTFDDVLETQVKVEGQRTKGSYKHPFVGEEPHVRSIHYVDDKSFQMKLDRRPTTKKEKQ